MPATCKIKPALAELVTGESEVPTGHLSPLVGTSVFMVDAKGRITFPRSLWSTWFGQEFYLAPLPGRRVIAFRESELASLCGVRETRLRELELSLAFPVELQRGADGDRTRRLLIPVILRDHLQIKPGDEIAVSGAGEYVVLTEYREWRRQWSELQGF